MHAADLPAAYVLKTQPVPAVIQVNVRTKSGAKTENALLKKKNNIVMNAMKSAEKDFEDVEALIEYIKTGNR